MTTLRRAGILLSLVALMGACGPSDDAAEGEWDVYDLTADAGRDEPQPEPEPDPRPDLALAAHAACGGAILLEPGVTRDEDTRRGGDPIFEGCGADLSGRTHYYLVSMTLGEGWRYDVEANAPGRRVKIQVISPDDVDVCAQSDLASCSDAQVGGPTAGARMDASIGGGRSPAVALVAVTVEPGEDPGDDTTFTVTLDRER